jgi:hydrogenase small subunit
VATEGFEFTADRLGLTIVAATAAGFAAHGLGKAVQHRVGAAREAREARAAAVPEVDMSGGDHGDFGEPDGR